MSTVDITRWGDWDRPAADDVPAELRAEAERWLVEGGPLTRDDMTALVHGKHMRLMRALVETTALLDRLREEAQDRYRRAVEPLSGPMRLSEAYERGYQMGQVRALDVALTDLTKIRDELSRHMEGR